MNFWTVAHTIYMTCCIQAAMSQGETVFSISLNVGGQTVDFNFSETMFIRFYHCLRNKDHTLCDVQRNNQNEVTTIRTCLPVINSQKTDEFTCRPVGIGFVCKGVNFPPPGFNASQCTVTYDIRDDVTLSQQVRLTWDGVDSVTMENDAVAYGIVVSRPGDKTYVISGRFTMKVTTTTTTTTTVKTTRRTDAPGQASTLFSQDSSTITSPGTDKQKSDEDGNDNNMPISIGATVAGVVILAIIVIIVIILWRRKKRPSPSSTTDNNKQNDMDIYLNSGSTLSNIKPNANSNEVTYYSNELTPHMHTTVDPNKMTNETTSSESCTAKSDNKLQQKKPQISPYLNYTEAAIDNDAGLDSQSSSDVNSGQGMTVSTPDTSAKATYYNFLSETG